jgi:uncharacterized membrane protein YtjA (UPF0391 family)
VDTSRRVETQGCNAIPQCTASTAFLEPIGTRYANCMTDESRFLPVREKPETLFSSDSELAVFSDKLPLDFLSTGSGSPATVTYGSRQVRCAEQWISTGFWTICSADYTRGSQAVLDLGGFTVLRSLLGLSVVFFILSLIAALFGFVMDSTVLWGLAKILFFILIAMAVLSFLWVWFTQSRQTP